MSCCFASSLWVLYFACTSTIIRSYWFIYAHHNAALYMILLIVCENMVIINLDNDWSSLERLSIIWNSIINNITPFNHNWTNSFEPFLYWTQNVMGKSGPRFNIRMIPHQHRKFHCGDKTILRPYYLHNGIFYIGKTASLYWIRAQVDIPWSLMPWLHESADHQQSWYWICMTKRDLII